MSVVVLFIFAEVSNRKIRQEIHKAALRLRYKRSSVGKEQDIFHPAVIQQDIAE